MNLDEVQARLHKLGVDIALDTLKGWAYTLHIIPEPERYKHGKGSGKKGRAASWSEEAVYTAAAVWAVRHSPRIAHHPSLRLIPYIGQAADRAYKEHSSFIYGPYTGRVPVEELTYKSFNVNFMYRPGIQKLNAEWQAIMQTWIAAYEKAKRGIPLDVPKQVRFYWHSVETEGGIDHKFDKVTLEPSESGEDDIITLMDGVDYRKHVLAVLKSSTLRPTK